MLQESIKCKKAPKAIGPYSQAIKLGDYIFVSGQIGVDPERGIIVSNDIKDQTKQCLTNIAAILSEINLSLKHVLKTTVYMTDLNEFNCMNDAYAEFFREPYPSRSTVQVVALPRGAKIEIEVMAIDTLALEVICNNEEVECDECCVEI